MIFAREISDNLTSLVKKIDAATVANNDMRSFVVFCSDEEGLPKKLKDLAAKEGIKRTVLAMDNPAGPGGYSIPKEADVTVILYVKHNVKVNHAFKKGELKDVDAVIKDLDKILPKK
jgi:hypothetical protein